MIVMTVPIVWLCTEKRIYSPLYSGEHIEMTEGLDSIKGEREICFRTLSDEDESATHQTRQDRQY